MKTTINGNHQKHTVEIAKSFGIYHLLFDGNCITASNSLKTIRDSRRELIKEFTNAAV